MKTSIKLIENFEINEKSLIFIYIHILEHHFLKDLIGS